MKPLTKGFPWFERSFVWHLEHINWLEHIDREVHVKSFDAKYHMTLDAFKKLVNKIRAMIEPNMFQSKGSTLDSGVDVISAEIIAGMGLHFLGGEYIKSLEDIIGVHKNHVRYLIFEKFLLAIDEAFEFLLPSTVEECQGLADDFFST